MNDSEDNIFDEKNVQKGMAGCLGLLAQYFHRSRTSYPLLSQSSGRENFLNSAPQKHKLTSVTLKASHTPLGA